MTRFGFITILLVSLSALCAGAQTIEKFPPPDFVETGHEFPQTTTPPPDNQIYEYVDSMVLLASMLAATYLIYRRRSRKGIFALVVFSLLYFGFWRKGCICPIGALQNVTLTIFDSSYVIPLTALFFFLVPLVFALFAGRVFCAAVCPLGAIQDLVAVKPISIPVWLEGVLRLFAYVYLAAAVLFAATGSAFVICRYDPFVAFFRLSGNVNILIIGTCLLLIGTVVARPYCRFLCPYGLILRQFSRLAKKRVTITPDECIKCRLCEDSCPFGAIRMPTVPWPDTDYARGKRTLGIMIILLPVLGLLLGWCGYALSPTAARVHATVRLADRIHMENTGLVGDTTDASDAFRATGKSTKELFAEADAIIGDFVVCGWIAGAFLGIVAGAKLIRNALRPNRDQYTADRASCLACGRCYEWCPREQLRLKVLKQGVAKC